MEWMMALLVDHAFYAHWYLFGAIILAGFSFPISADLLVLLAAFLAAVVIPEHTPHLVLSLWVGCYLSAWCAYSMGRFLGGKLQKYSFFKKILPEKRMMKMHAFYDKYGFWALLLGRFIPCGVRNALFMTMGCSRVRFLKFVSMDLLACSIWILTLFGLFYVLSQDYERVWQGIQNLNGVLFTAFGVTVIALIWYKSKKRSRKRIESH